jgi:hypothetical protein
MHGTKIEKEVELCATNLAKKKKTNCMNTSANKLGKIVYICIIYQSVA